MSEENEKEELSFFERQQKELSEGFSSEASSSGKETSETFFSQPSPSYNPESESRNTPEAEPFRPVPLESNPAPLPPEGQNESPRVIVGDSDSTSIIDLRHYFFLLFYYRFGILFFILIFTALQSYFVINSEDLYSATSIIVEEKEEQGINYLPIQDKSATSETIVLNKLKSKNNLERAISNARQQVDWYKINPDSTKAEYVPYIEKIISNPSLETILSNLDSDQLESATTASAMEKAQYRISVSFSSGPLASLFAFSISDAFIELNQEETVKHKEDLRSKLEARIEEKNKEVVGYKKDIEKIKSELSRSASGTGEIDILRSKQELIIKKIQSLDQLKQNAELEKNQLAKKLYQLQSTSWKNADIPFNSRFAVELTELEVELQAMLMRYTPEHPNVSALQKTLNSKKKEAHEVEIRNTESLISDLDMRIATYTQELKRENQLHETYLPQFNALSELNDKLKATKNNLDKMREYHQTTDWDIDNAKSDFQLLEREDAILVSQHPTIRILIGSICGFLVSFIYVYIREQLNHSIRTPDEARSRLNMKILGVIPDWGRDRPHLIRGDDPTSMVSEAFAVVRTNIRYAGHQHPEKCLLVASAMQREGKTVTALNLAISFAQEGSKVLFLNADMRKRNQAYIKTALGCPASLELGLSDYLSTEDPYEKFIHPTFMENLWVMPGGQRVMNPPKLLGQTKMSRLLKMVEKDYDVVIVDGTAVIPVADLTLISNQVRGVVLLVQAEKTSMKHVQNCLERLNQVRSPLIGCILNRSKRHSHSRYSEYAYQYEEQD